MKKVFGIGINDYNGNIAINGNKIKSYQTWQDMLMRCYSKKYQEKHPTYTTCTVCEDWLKFSKFKEWFDSNYPDELVRELNIEFQLDKDLLIENNKIYSPDTCVFLPKKVNVFIANKQRNNTSGYIGVSIHNSTGKWRVRVNDFYTNKGKHLGLFTNIEDARDTYIKAREVEAEKCKEYLGELGYNEKIINKIK